jgi:hypothetical protein
MLFKLWLRFSMLKEIVAEPYLSKMRLILVGRVDLLDSVELLGTEVKPLPNFTESTSS